MVLSPKLLGCLYLPQPGLNASPKEGTLPRAPSTAAQENRDLGSGNHHLGQLPAELSVISWTHRPLQRLVQLRRATAPSGPATPQDGYSCPFLGRLHT